MDWKKVGSKVTVDDKRQTARTRKDGSFFVVFSETNSSSCPVYQYKSPTLLSLGDSSIQSKFHSESNQVFFLEVKSH